MEHERTKIIREELIRLENSLGTLTPDKVVEAATPVKSPIHPCFDWDNTSAGHKYRLEQARGLIQSVKYRVTTEKKVFTVARYVRDPRVDPQTQGYVSVPKLKEDPAAALKAVQWEFSRVQQALERLEILATVLEAKSVVTAARKHMKRVQAKVEKSFAI